MSINLNEKTEDKHEKCFLSMITIPIFSRKTKLKHFFHNFSVIISIDIQ